VSDASSDVSNLGDLPVGGRGVVREVGGKRGLRNRLLEMGLLPGTEVQITRRAPMGDPIELSLRGYSLSLRKEDARAIGIDPIPAPEGASVLAPAE